MITIKQKKQLVERIPKLKPINFQSVLSIIYIFQDKQMSKRNHLVSWLPNLAESTKFYIQSRLEIQKMPIDYKWIDKGF